MMPIRIRYRDKPRYRAQQNEYKELIAFLVIALMVCYTDQSNYCSALRGRE
jgi:hypothetical protein